MEADASYFPIEYSNLKLPRGISVRDKLAESAMIGFLSGDLEVTKEWSNDKLAKECYLLADALLSQSNK